MKNRGTTTRRDFLTATGQTAVAGIGLGGLVTTQASAVEPCRVEAPPKQWDETCDVVVVGSGFAGLAAAWEARKTGASVAILEKMPTAGGNSIINGGTIAAAGSPLQGQRVTDSPEQFAAEMIREGLGLNHPDLVKITAEQSWPTVKWTIEEMGVQYSPHLVHEIGHALPRSYKTDNGSGSAIVARQLAKLQEIGQEVRVRTCVERILREADGRVMGVQVREGYEFPRRDGGMLKFIRATKALVLAYGGFSADIAYRLKHDPKLTAAIDCASQPGATAALLRESLRIGASAVQLSGIQVEPCGSADEQGLGLGLRFAHDAAAMFGLWIDAATGRRFISELAHRKLRADAIMNIMNQGGTCLALADAGQTHGDVEQNIAKMLELGVIKPFDDIEAIAAAYKVPLEPFRRQIETFNKFVVQKKDDQFGRYIHRNATPIGIKAPIYVLRLMPKVHSCMGGIQIDALARVIDVLTDEPIPGLYAAGEATGGILGAATLGGCSTLSSLVWGRIAGRNAGAEKA